MVGQALQNLGIVATGTAVAGLLARYGIQRFSKVGQQAVERYAEVVEHGIERSAEVIEDGIDQYFEKEIARHQAERHSHRLESSRHHEKRADILLELYQRFVRFERDLQAVKSQPSGDRSIDQLLTQASDSGNDVRTYYVEHKIYFPPDTCDAIERLQDAMDEVLENFRAHNSHGADPKQHPTVEKQLTDWQAVPEDEIRDGKRELENHCRKLLGVELDEEQPTDS